jgi:hypothetical protein
MIATMRVAILALAAGCGHPASAPDAPAADAVQPDASSLVTGRTRVADVRNDAQHVPQAGDSALRSVVAMVRQPDATWAAVDVAADGSFSFASPGVHGYRFAVANDGGPVAELQLAAPHLELANRLGARYERAPVPAGTALQVSLTGVPATGIAWIQSTGVWTNFQRANGTNASFTQSWTNALGLLDAGAHDRAYATILDSVGAAPPYATITAACSADVTMTGGAATPMACSLAPAPLDHCMHLHLGYAGESARLVASTPVVYPSLTYAWNIYVAPAPSLGPVGILEVAGQGNTVSPAVDLDRDQVKYAQPFPGHAPMLVMTMERYRSFALPATTPVNLYLYTQHHVPAAPDCTTVTSGTSTVAIAGVPSLAGTALSTDNQKLTIDRSGDLDLSWPVGADGRADYWQVGLFSVVASGGATTLVPARSWIVTDTHVALDPALLVAGTPYLVEIFASEGFENSASGDFRTVSYPDATFAVSQQSSAIFEVTN